MTKQKSDDFHEYELPKDQYLLEARLIGQYILSADELLTDQLRSSLLRVVNESVESVWNKESATKIFDQKLTHYFQESSRRVLTQDKTKVLYNNLVRELSGFWEETIEKAVEQSIKKVLSNHVTGNGKQKQVAGRRGRHPIPLDQIDEGVKEVDLGEIITVAVSKAMEKQLENYTVQMLFKRIEDEINHLEIAKKAESRIKARVDEEVRKSLVNAGSDKGNIQWKDLTHFWKGAVFCSFLVPMALIGLALWVVPPSPLPPKDVDLNKTQQEALVEGVNPQSLGEESLEDRDVRSGKNGVDRSGNRDRSEDDERLHQVWKTSFESIMEKEKAKNIRFREVFLSDSDKPVFEDFFGDEPLGIAADLTGYQAAITRLRKVKCVRMGEERKVVFVLQVLLSEIGRKQMESDEWWYGYTENKDRQKFLDGFSDGHWGSGTKRFAKHVLSKKPIDGVTFFQGEVAAKQLPDMAYASYFCLMELASNE